MHPVAVFTILGRNSVCTVFTQPSLLPAHICHVLLVETFVSMMRSTLTVLTYVVAKNI